MKKPKLTTTTLEINDGVDHASHVVGEIAAIDAAGRASVVFPGNRIVPIEARSALNTPLGASQTPDSLIGSPVLLVFENANPEQPIIVGLLHEALCSASAGQEIRLDPNRERDVLIDGERIIFDAKQEILLRCGESTLLMRRDGKVLIRGSNLLSRSRGPNKIKGASINLN